MNVWENIRFPLKVRKVPEAEHEERVRRASAMVELDDFLHRKPAALSGGQRQRVALARAIVRTPKVFLMDEPLSNLDAKLRQHMRVQIKHIQRELRTTTVYVTHDQIEAMTLADRIVIMEKGTIQQIGTPDEIYNDPANTFVANFIGSPPMNLIAGRLEGGVFTAPGVRVSGLAPRHAGAVTLGARPEDCLMDAQGAHVAGEIYGVEPTGDATYVTVRVGERLVEVKAPRDFRAALDTPAAVAFDPGRLYLFDTETGARLRGTGGDMDESRGAA
jgi:multiple sugar transport system ATP-binding protein